MEIRATTRPTALEEIFSAALKQQLDKDPDHCFKQQTCEIYNVYTVEKDNKKIYFSNKVKAKKFAKLVTLLVVCAVPALRAEEVEVEVSATFREAVHAAQIVELPQVDVTKTITQTIVIIP